jgi:hypothetical protein
MALKESPDLLTPILVTGMGRSGSTLAMQLIGTDPSCVFDQVYPLESRYLSLISHFAAQWQGWTFADYGQTASAYQSVLGSNPVVVRNTVEQDAGSGAAAKLLNIPQSGDVLLSLWKQFSLAARVGKPNARFYGEKAVEWLPLFLAPYLDSYALYLFRDPRDLFISANKFNSKRGYLAFGRTGGDTDRDHAITLAFKFMLRFENYRVFKASGGKASLTRYEDLALNPIPTLAELVTETGIQITPLKDADSFSQHRTSGSVEQSINRWKREPISQDVLDVFDEILFDILTEMKYETNRSTSGMSLDFCGADSEALKSRLANVEHAAVFSFSNEGMKLTPAAGSTEISIELKMNDIPMDEILEIWVCLSGSFGGALTLGWASGSSDYSYSTTTEVSKQYDPGQHCTALRFSNLANEESFKGPLSKLLLKIQHSGLPAIDPSANLRLVKLVSRPKASSNAADTVNAADEATSGRNKGFFNQLLGVIKNDK